MSRSTLLVCSLGFAASLIAPAAPAIELDVNIESDAVDANPGDGICDSDLAAGGDQCSLRAAVMETNATGGADTITLPAGRFSLSIKNRGADAEDASAGDLDVTGPLTVEGAGATLTEIRGKKFSDRLFDTYANLTLRDLTLTKGKALEKNEPGQLEAGGGGCVRGRASLVLDTVNVVKCKAEGDGGGVVQVTGSLEITDSLLTKNKAKEDGGGVAVEPANTVIEGSTFFKNKSSDEGGGLAIDGGFADVTNSTFSGNKGKEEGGGILNEEGGNLELVHVTFFNNKAKQGDSIHVNDTLNPPTTTATNSIFFSKRKKGANNCRIDVVVITSLGGNVANGSSCGLTAGGDLQDTDPGLEKKLLDNGGPTPTHALEADSPAVDRTNQNCEAVDQRGAARDALCDAGAFEL